MIQVEPNQNRGNLSVIDFDTDDKPEYKFNGKTYFLKPPYMYLTDKFQRHYKLITDIYKKDIDRKKKLTKDITELTEGEIQLSKMIEGITGETEMKELIHVQVDILKLLLDGETNLITAENIRQDVYNRVTNDFFQQSVKSKQSVTE